MSNTGTSYEIITQKIFDSILNRTDVKTVSVKRNVTIQGKETAHQIDVYWEFQAAGITYYTVVQAKDLARRVSKSSLLEFKAVLRDLPNQPRGVFVTRTGYQKGSLEIAKANGILLYELREPTERDKKGRSKIVLNLVACVPYTAGIHFEFDRDWMVREGIRLGLNEIPEMRLSLEPQEIMLYDETGTSVLTVKELTDSFYPHSFEELPSTKVIYKFEAATFMGTGVAEFPRLRLTELEATTSVGRVEETVTLDLDDLVGFILKSVLEGTERIFDKEGNALI